MDFDPQAELDDVVALLTALQSGEPLPEVTGKASELPGKINALNDGLADLNSGAQTLAEGAAALDSGLATLSANSEALNDGADDIFSAILETANQQLAASGLAEAGIEVPELTPDNYADTLTALIAQFDSETVLAAARPQVEAVVRPQVEANEEQIRGAVTEAVRAQVLSQVLAEAGMDMDAEAYASAVEAGQVDEAARQQVQAAVDAQMETDAVKELIEAQTAEQIEQLVSDNTDQALATDETVAAKLAQAQEAHDTLQSLLDRLNGVNTFVTGLKTYTAGVDQAATGASDLSAGATTLHDSGTDALQAKITDAEKEAAEKLLPILNGDVSTVLEAYNQLAGQAGTAGYDLRDEAWDTTTLYVIRTDFN
jgi:putative membrane protein